MSFHHLPVALGQLCVHTVSSSSLVLGRFPPRCFFGLWCLAFCPLFSTHAPVSGLWSLCFWPLVPGLLSTSPPTPTTMRAGGLGSFAVRFCWLDPVSLEVLLHCCFGALFPTKGFHSGLCCWGCWRIVSQERCILVCASMTSTKSALGTLSVWPSVP